MPDSLVSIFAYNSADIINSLYLAAEEYDYYPAHIHFISAGTEPPSARDHVQSLLHNLFEYYDTEPEIEIHTVPSQFDFREVQSQLDTILTSADRTGTISIDLTGEPALLNAFLFYIAAEDDREYEHLFYCSRDPPKKNADFLLTDLETDYVLHRLGEK